LDCAGKLENKQASMITNDFIETIPN
jgi:hypothetical protein